MTLNGKPWLIGGGVEHPVEVGRALAYMATMGASGVGTPDSFKVRATTVPGPSVLLGPGIGAAASAYGGGLPESYVLWGDDDTEQAITPTGAGGRSDLVVARIRDPQHEGTWPADPQAGDYAFPYVVQGVPAGQKGTRGLGLQFPCIALARIDIPANTATITDGMIKDVRRLAAPRTQIEKDATVPPGTTAVTTKEAAKARWGSFRPIFNVPSWATRVRVTAFISSALITGDTAGLIDVRFGTLRSSDLAYDFESASGSETQRDGLIVTGAWDIPDGWQETDRAVEIWANRADGKTGTLALKSSQVMVEVVFSEDVR
jgi:hypothetical protein